MHSHKHCGVKVHKNVDIGETIINHPQFYTFYGCYKHLWTINPYGWFIIATYAVGWRLKRPGLLSPQCFFGEKKRFLWWKPKTCRFRVEEIWTFKILGFIFWRETFFLRHRFLIGSVGLAAVQCRNCHIAPVPTQWADYHFDWDWGAVWSLLVQWFQYVSILVILATCS